MPDTCGAICTDPDGVTRHCPRPRGHDLHGGDDWAWAAGHPRATLADHAAAEEQVRRIIADHCPAHAPDGVDMATARIVTHILRPLTAEREQARASASTLAEQLSRVAEERAHLRQAAARWLYEARAGVTLTPDRMAVDLAERGVDLKAALLAVAREEGDA